MYGLINKAVEGLVRSKFGDDTWNRIRTRAGLPDEPFISMEMYSDKSTYDLVGAASAELGVEAEKILEEFGRYWVSCTAQESYGELLKSVGRTLPEFLKNLDQMHTRIKLSFTHLTPPSFAVTDETSNSLQLHYYTHRAGLAPLVTGILEALGPRFKIKVTSTTRRVEGDRPHDVFDVRWEPAAAV